MGASQRGRSLAGGIARVGVALAGAALNLYKPEVQAEIMASIADLLDPGDRGPLR